MKLYLLRVGADFTPNGGGFHSRIFKDRSYLFIPIPEKKENLITSKALTYRDFKWHNKAVIPYLPRKIWSDDPPDQFIHNDPEFVTFTYGSPKYNSKGMREKNYNALLEMEKGDILAFYAAFSGDSANIDGLYLFAYFVVNCVIEWSDPDGLSQEKQALVRNNHHFIHRRPNQVVVVGFPDKSRVFKKAILLSSRITDRRGSNYYPCLSIQQNLAGYNKSMNLSSLRNPPGIEVAGLFKDYLDLHCK
jgi:hypothetical protein